jgi:hypothetical protein
MRRLVPAGRGDIAVLPATHQTYLEAPAAYEAAVLRFLDRVVPDAPAVAHTPRPEVVR